jgi:hypothetical protein
MTFSYRILDHFTMIFFNCFGKSPYYDRNSSETDTREHLESIVAVLLSLRDDVKKMSVDIAEVRVELIAINTALGMGQTLMVLTRFLYLIS